MSPTTACPVFFQEVEKEEACSENIGHYACIITKLYRFNFNIKQNEGTLERRLK